MSDQKKQHIIQTAITLFAEKGYEGTTIRDLAKRAKVNVAMVNYYFGSKEKLFEALVESRAGYMRNLLDELKVNKTLSHFEKIEHIIFHYVNRILDNRAFFQVMQQEMLVSVRPELNRNISEVLIKNVDEIVKIIHSGIRKKEFRKVDAQLTFASIIGTDFHETISPSIITCPFLAIMANITNKRHLKNNCKHRQRNDCTLLM